jgi:cytochrome c oxidase subunit IV
MAEPHLTADEEMKVESHAPYFKVWTVLLVLTILEYFYASLFQASFYNLVVGLMLMACIKASLVGWYFMHLKFEGKWVYGFLLPAAFLACVVIFALIPDIAMRMEEESPVIIDDPSVSAAPLLPSAPSV